MTASGSDAGLAAIWQNEEPLKDSLLFGAVVQRVCDSKVAERPLAVGRFKPKLSLLPDRHRVDFVDAPASVRRDRDAEDGAAEQEGRLVVRADRRNVVGAD